MAFNRKTKLRDNIEAIRTLFELEKQGRAANADEKLVLSRYCGFGGLKCILNPAANLMDAAGWAKSDRELFSMTAELHRLIRDNSTDEKEYKRYFDSLKSSVLTAFYTPPEVVSALADTLHAGGITPNRLLDPSAGQGVFISAFEPHAPKAEVMAFDKDLITGKLLSHLYPQHKVRGEGFERIEKPFTNYFDVATSNIPFGDVAVFDPEFTGAGDYSRRAASKTIHNYFFLKGLDAVRDGGIVAFITSQGVMNAREGAIRMEMLKRADLVSAIRLPNNLFVDSANTEVGSDLIILQKNESKQGVSETDKLFANSTPEETGILTNNYFQKFPQQIVSTKVKIDTDPYGKPAMVYLHEGGVEGIATEMRKILSADFTNRLNLDLYNGVSSQQSEEFAPSGTMHQEQTAQQEPIPRDWQESTKEPVKKEEKLEATLPIMTLYDLFNFSQEEKQLAQMGITKKQKRKTTKLKPEAQKSLFEQLIDIVPQEKEGSIVQREEQKTRAELMKPRPFNRTLERYYKEGTLVINDNQVGYLKEITRYGVTFHPLDLENAQRKKIELYIALRDSYERLYYLEADRREENKEERARLNAIYDEFIGKFGHLNEKVNVKFLLMDASGRDMLSLERVENGQFIKTDIFDHPVAFSLNEVIHVDTPMEALSASLNRYGAVNLDYMESLCDNSKAELLKELEGRIYFNPLINNYEIKDRFVAGNVVEKIENLSDWVTSNKGHKRIPEVEASLSALKEAIPRPITFNELDFNFGERWIPTGIYTTYIKQLFDTDVSILYSENIDEYSVHCGSKNAKILDQYAVQGDFRKYDGINLLKHALVNTVPDISKSIGKDEHGNDIKVRDAERIQLANSKIDEIRNGFTDWLNEQPTELQQRLTDMYNRKFNCFVRPLYDGSHQEFPGLDLKALAKKYKIKEVYQSQKDCVWMLKQNGGGICDHEVLRP